MNFSKGMSKEWSYVSLLLGREERKSKCCRSKSSKKKGVEKARIFVRTWVSEEKQTKRKKREAQFSDNSVERQHVTQTEKSLWKQKFVLIFQSQKRTVSSASRECDYWHFSSSTRRQAHAISGEEHVWVNMRCLVVAVLRRPTRPFCLKHIFVVKNVLQQSRNVVNTTIPAERVLVTNKLQKRPPEVVSESMFPVGGDAWWTSSP